jgi:hypothetical protein
MPRFPDALLLYARPVETTQVGRAFDHHQCSDQSGRILGFLIDLSSTSCCQTSKCCWVLEMMPAGDGGMHAFSRRI